jgi:hypothetical protein
MSHDGSLSARPPDETVSRTKGMFTLPLVSGRIAEHAPLTGGLWLAEENRGSLCESDRTHVRFVRVTSSVAIFFYP